MSDDENSSADKPRSERSGIKNADVPSDTVGLPDAGEGASARHYARDVVEEGQRGDDGEEDKPHAPADPREQTG